MGPNQPPIQCVAEALSPGKSRRGGKLALHLQSFSRLRISGGILPLPLHIFMGCAEKILYSKVESNRPYTGLIIEIFNPVKCFLLDNSPASWFLNQDAGELPKRKHITDWTRRKLKIKNPVKVCNLNWHYNNMWQQ